MKGHGCLLSGWQAPEFSCKCLIFRCESIYYRMINFFIRSVKNEYEWDCRKTERQRMAIEMGSGTCLQYFRIFYRQDDPG